MTNQELINIAEDLGLNNIKSIEAFGSGHINDTFKVTTTNDVVVMQRINDDVFKKPDELMENTINISKHISKQGKTSLDIIAYKNPWRLVKLIDNAHSINEVSDPKQAFIAGAAFGQFQNLVADFPADKLHDTIPNFHNTVMRLEQLDAAAIEDKYSRLKNISQEMAFVDDHRAIASKVLDLMDSGKIPLRVTHNDTKINNVMLDNDTEQAIAVIDLDTVMPGSALYDFGDMVRTATASAAEDEKDLSKVYSKPEYFEALTKGYLSSAKFLNEFEIDNLVFSGILITFTIGIRFLADYLAGDVYFKTDFDDHNLVRAKNQFKMVKSIEDQYEQFNKIVKKYI